MRITDAEGKLACPQAMPIEALASFGSQTKTPTLWIYSENDSNFGPDAARTAHATYVAHGGVAELKVVPSLHPADGHNVFELPAGRQRWLAALDPFLRTHKLPTWSAQQMKTVMQRFKIAAASGPWLEGYFSLYTPKVLAQALEWGAELLGRHRGIGAGAEGRPGGVREGREDAVPRHYGELQCGRSVATATKAGRHGRATAGDLGGGGISAIP